MSDFGFDLDIDLSEEKEVEEDDFDIEVPEEPKAKLGDIYQLGNHRLMCGDSTKEEDVNKLVGEQKIDLLITDPPYNVEVVGGNHSESPTERKKKGNLTILNDKMDNDSFHEFLLNAFKNAYNVLKDGASFYVWYASREVVNFNTSIEEAGFTVKQELIWNKNSIVMGRQDYQWKHESCLYGWKETNSHSWYSDRKQTTVIDWNRPTKSDLHPTMKPIGLFDYQIKNSSKQGDNILDLFGGSGTTIMACEQNNRNAYVMEYDPRYVDVIIKRWEEFTGKKAVLLNDSSSN
jgi:site-specific DNA-methyltransferase (adenine-specific)